MPSTRFPQTRWSVVLAARDVKDSVAQAALTDLCQIYWKPIYGFCRQMGNAAEDAEDLTQAFFVKLIEKDFLVLDREGEVEEIHEDNNTGWNEIFLRLTP